jgi:hypothetical protein
MSATFRLNCYVVGHNTSHIFAVEVDKSDDVNALKERIKAYDLYAPATAFTLYHVSIPTDNCFEENLVNLDLSDAIPLNPLAKVLSVFTSPLKASHLHIVVKPQFRCKRLCLCSSVLLIRRSPRSSPQLLPSRW